MAPNAHLTLVDVQILQDDLEDFDFEANPPSLVELLKNADPTVRSSLLYPVPERKTRGMHLFSHNVLWGEVWFADRSARGMWYAGYVRNGALFLDQSSPELEPRRREELTWNRTHLGQRPSKLPVGHYKVWLDAWVRGYAYANDPPFTNDPIAGNGGPWVAPPPPHRKYWQDIEVTPPAPGDAACKLRLKSRRFHWLYRLNRLADALNALLIPVERLMASVAEVRNLAEYLRVFLGVVYDSNITRLHRDPEQHEHVKEIGITLFNVVARCNNFVQSGIADGIRASPIPFDPEREHINNLAHLLWRLINNASFAEEIAVFSPELAEEHRIGIAGLGFLFNRIPRILLSLTPSNTSAGAGDNEAEDPTAQRLLTSFDFGAEFARRFTLPYFNNKLERAGKPPAFDGAPAGTVKILDTVRKYGSSMLNSASIFVAKESVRWSAIASLLQQEGQLWGRAAEADSLFETADKFIAKYRAAGKMDLVEMIERNKMYFLKEAASPGLSGRIIDPKLHALKAELDQVREQMNESMKRQPQKVLDYLKKANPAIVYGVQGFEIFVKWSVAAAAWNEFRGSAGIPEGRPGRSPFQPIMKTADAMGSTLQFLGLHRFIREGWALFSRDVPTESVATAFEKRLAALSRLGKACNATHDISQAIVYSMDLFVDHAYSDELLERYMPEDAIAACGFHLIIWGGKWMVAIGSGSSVFSSTPVGVAIHALGYLAQLIGEVGESVAEYGAWEKKCFDDVRRELWNASRRAEARLREHGRPDELYPESENEKLRDLVGRFTMWHSDREELAKRLATRD
jgi:hypothetical protein